MGLHFNLKEKHQDIVNIGNQTNTVKLIQKNKEASVGNEGPKNPSD